MPLDAAELAYRYIDASYRSTDSCKLDEHGGLPGVTREYHRTITVGKWGEIDYVNGGIEGYGWGALSLHLLMRYLLGLQEEEVNRISVHPVLPQALRRAGAIYHADNVPWGKYTLNISCMVRDVKSYRLRLHCIVPATRVHAQGIQDTDTKQEREEYQCEWEEVWGEERTLQLPQLTTFSV
jgi:hypothetical protein